MALYLGREKKQVNINDITYLLNLFSSQVNITNNEILLSSDDFILIDSNEFYLTIEKEVQDV